MPYHVQTPGVSKESIVEQLKARSLSGILLTSAENVYYTTGLPVLPGSGNPILFALRNQLPFFAYLSADGKLTLLCWIGATMGFTFDADEVRNFFNFESALDELQDFLRETLPADASIGVEGTCPLYLLPKLYDLVSPSALVIVDDLLLNLRLTKTEGEIANIRRATQIVEATFASLQTEVKVGISRLDVINAAKRLMIEHGATGIGHTTIAFGTSNAEIAFDETLEAGQVVTIDLGASVNGYLSDNRRLLYSGAVPPELHALHSTMCSIVDQVGQALLPGTAFADLYTLAADLYATHDLPPYFLSVGHSLGLQTEEVWISPDSSLTVQSGMVLNVELYTPYHDGSNIGDEETFLVTETGVVKLTQSNPAILSI